MFRKVFSQVLLIAVLLQVGSRWLIFLEYEINKEYITATLCVNKERIPMCSGKCYLTDRLNQNQEQQQEQVPMQIKFAMEAMVVPSGKIVLFSDELLLSFKSSSSSNPFTECIWKHQLGQKGVFHPPC